MPEARLAAYRAAVAAVQAEVGDPAHVELVLQHLATHGQSPMIGDISGIGWYKLDTPEDVAVPALQGMQ